MEIDVGLLERMNSSHSVGCLRHGTGLVVIVFCHVVGHYGGPLVVESELPKSGLMRHQWGREQMLGVT